VTQYNSLEAKEHFDEFDFYDNSLHINTINEPVHINTINEQVAECTDNVKNFLDNFGFLDDLAPFDKKKYVQLFEYDDETVPLLDDPTESTHLLGMYQLVPVLTSSKTSDECFDIEKHIQFNYLGPKILKKAPGLLRRRVL
jgi:hypothetical protein